ncbi:hypothetical protein Tco_0719145 [Tanacetum coccineum]
MDITKAEQIALDDALVAPANRLKIGKCNLRLSSDLKSKEATLQVVYDVLKLTPFYKAFQASADVPEIYMQEFWATASVHNRSIRFKMNNKKHIVNLEYFREMLQICPKIRNQKFDEPPFEQEILTFLVSLGHSGEIRKITDVNVNKLHQPWRSFAAVINKCLSGKSSYDSLRLSQAQIIWGMYHKKNVDYAFLLWEDFTYQVENKNTKKLYGAILPKELTNEDIRNSESYKGYYAIASGEVPPKTKASVHKKKADSDTTPKEKPLTDPKDKRVKQTGKMTGSGKQKQPTTGLDTLSDIALTETEQLKKAIKRSRIQTHSSQASGSGDGVDILSKVPDEQVHEKTGTNEGAGDKPEVPDVPEHHSNSEEESWTFSDGDDDDDDANEDSDEHNDEYDVTKSDDDGDNITHLKLSTFSTDDQEEQDDEEQQEDNDEDEEEISNQLLRTPSDYQTSDERGDVDMTEADTTKDTKDAHMTLTAATPVVQQQSSSVSDLSKVEKYVTESLGAEVLIRSTNQPQTSYGIASSLSELELKKILMDKIEENKSIDISNVQKNLYNALVEAYNTDKDLLSFYGDVIIIPTTREDKDKDEEPSAGSNRGTKSRRSGKEAESSKEPTRKESRTTSSLKGAPRSQPTDLNETTHLEFITSDDDVNPAREVQDERQWHPSTSTTPDPEWHLTKTVSDLPPQHWITDLAQAAGTQSSFDEFMATPIDFSAFTINRLKIDHLAQELLTGPTYDLIKGTCKSVAELDYHLEEVFKATNEQLDWNNPEGTSYPHNLSKPLLLIPNAQGRLVIPFDHLINNDLEYLKGGSSSRKYTTSITKTKAADYGQVKWIEDRIPRTTWSVDVYSRHRIIAVISLKIMKFFGYSHLEEITVRRQDDVLYKFREGDFKRLRRQDIEDMLLLLVQDKLTNLSLDDRYALNPPSHLPLLSPLPAPPPEIIPATTDSRPTTISSSSSPRQPYHSHTIYTTITISPRHRHHHRSHDPPWVRLARWSVTQEGAFGLSQHQPGALGCMVPPKACLVEHSTKGCVSF